MVVQIAEKQGPARRGGRSSLSTVGKGESTRPNEVNFRARQCGPGILSGLIGASFFWDEAEVLHSIQKCPQHETEPKLLVWRFPCLTVYASVCPKSFDGLGLGGGGRWLPSRPSRGSGTEEKILRSNEYRSSKRWACWHGSTAPKAEVILPNDPSSVKFPRCCEEEKSCIVVPCPLSPGFYDVVWWINKKIEIRHVRVMIRLAFDWHATWAQRVRIRNNTLNPTTRKFSHHLRVREVAVACSDQRSYFPLLRSCKAASEAGMVALLVRCCPYISAPKEKHSGAGV